MKQNLDGTLFPESKDLPEYSPIPTRTLIYGLVDNRNQTLFYVGKTHRRREFRLLEHIEAALNRNIAPVHRRIRSMILRHNTMPQIFVLARVPPGESWQQEERRQIDHWRNFPPERLPLIYPPQTPKSKEIEIQKVDLLNVQEGG